MRLKLIEDANYSPKVIDNDGNVVKEFTRKQDLTEETNESEDNK
jgi:hypothetical protein